jgi:serpin B
VCRRAPDEHRKSGASVGNLPPVWMRQRGVRSIMRFASTLTVLALVAAACGGGDVTPPETTTGPSDGELELVRADVPRVSSTDVSDAELATLVSGNTAFAFDLFHQVAADENLLVSPYSVAAALTMTYAGARGTTATEIATNSTSG